MTVARTSEKYLPYTDMPPETNWKISADHINKFQQSSIMTLVKLAKAAHYVDVVVRINGEYRVIQADWLKHLEQT